MSDAIIVKPEALQKCAEVAAEIRHVIHHYPEIGLDLPQTEKTIVEALKSFGCENISTRVGGPDVAGVVCVIEGDEPGRTIGLRADSDALPLNENTGVAYSSGREKHMHACGHDGHVATLLAVVKYFMEHRHFAGTLVAIFQPGEEGFAGAKHMVDDGLVERFHIDEFYALHAEPTLDVGTVGFVPGYATANADIFEIVPENEYPADYQTVVDQARNEIKAGARPALQESDLDLTPYDTLFVGSPCWWSTIAPPVATFLTTHDFAGKTIVPFMTHEGSRMGHSESDIRDLCPKATLLPGLPIRGSEAGKADAAIKKWLQTHDLLKK